jgi:exoribonuclease R
MFSQVRVKTRQRSLLVGNRFVIRIDGWDHDSKLPKGHVVKILGPIGDLETENRAILVENEINILPFTTL